MKAIMISDKPKWCALMMNGIKNIEVRKNKALASAIQKLIDENGYADIYVYCTFPKKHHELLDKDLVSGEWKLWYGTYTPKNGKVIFKFRCYKLENIEFFEEFVADFYNNGYRTKTLNDIDLYKDSCLTQSELRDYLDECDYETFVTDGYAIHISVLEIFDEPKELREFKRCTEKTCIYGKCHKYMHCLKPLTKAPQNFCYVEVEEDE